MECGRVRPTHPVEHHALELEQFGFLGISTKRESSVAPDCVVELVGLEPTTRVLWNMGVSDQLTRSDTRPRARRCTGSRKFLHLGASALARIDEEWGILKQARILRLRANAWWSWSDSNQPPK